MRKPYLPPYTVWSIFDNAYVTLDYWEWVNNRDNAAHGHLHNTRLGGREKDRTSDSQEHSENAEN